MTGINAVEQHKEDLRDLAQSDLPASELAEALIEAADETGD